MCFNQTGNISTLNGSTQKLVDKFTYLGSSVWSTVTDINTRLAKAWTAIDRLSVIWKSDLTDKMKHSFFQAAIVSILLHECTTWTLTKWMEKKLDGNYTRMLRAILNKSWRQHPIKIWESEDLPKAMGDREVWRETVRNIRADRATWWHIYIYICNIYLISFRVMRSALIWVVWMTLWEERLLKSFNRSFSFFFFYFWYCFKHKYLRPYNLFHRFFIHSFLGTKHTSRFWINFPDSCQITK